MGQVHLACLFLMVFLSGAEGASGRLSVELVDATGMPPEAMEELKREVEAIYAIASVRIEWSPQSADQLEEHGARAYIVHRLPAMLETRLRAFHGRRPMAASFGGKGGEATQAIYVSRTAVSANASSGGVLPPDWLGRALGRVLAHELAHRFISRDHSRDGILREELLPGDLTDPGTDLHFTNEQISLLREVDQPFAAPVAAK
jgi:hypothetical protein